MLRKNKITLCKSSLHLLLHLVLQLRLLRSFASLNAFARIRLRLVHLVLSLCSISTVLMNDFLPLVEPFFL